MNGNSQKRPPPPPRRQVPPPDVPEAKIKEEARPSTELQNLLNNLRKEQEERYRVQNGRGSSCRPRPPPPSNAGRGRGHGTTLLEETPAPPGKPEAPRPLRAPFASDLNQNVFQDADEKNVEKPKTLTERPIQTPKIGAEEKVKKEVVKSSVDANQNVFQDERKVEKPKTCSTQPQMPKNCGVTEIDAAVQKLILDDARPLPPEPPKFNLEDYVKKMPHSDDKKYIATNLSLEIKDLDRPIGMIVLSKTKTIIISEQGRNQVKMYNPDGSTKRVVRPGKAFFKPSDMVELNDGQFAVRDNNGIQLFSDQGIFIKNIGENFLGRVFGLTSNESGNIFTINHNQGKEKEGNVTAKGEVDIVEIDVVNDTVIRQIELVDVIQNTKESMCRFLHCNGNKLYIADLGLNCVYVLSLRDSTSVRKFGKVGKSDGQFKDPAGLVTDSFGNLILADAGNHRLQMFDRTRKYVGNVNVYQGLKRPSGIYLDPEEEALYVLNLNGKCMRKYALMKN